MPNAAWTAETIALLKRLWAEGETAAAIAARLGGISRSAVLGKVYRLRLGAGGGASAAPTPKKMATGETGVSLPRRRKGGKRKQQLQPPPVASRRGKTLLELTNDTCRWPHGRPGTTRFFFCGAAGADLERGMPYCARHMQRAYPACERSAREPKRPVSGGARLLLPSIRYARPRRPGVRTG